MSATYSITVHNQSSDVQNYLFFSEVPSLGPPIGQPYSNVWLTSPGTFPPNGTAQFDVTEADFAVCGSQEIGPGTVVETGDYTPVTLGVSTTTADATEANLIIVDQGPGFGPSTTTTSAGAYAISTVPFNPADLPPMYAGMGKYAADGKTVTPVAVWQLTEGDQTYVVTPVVKFYVGTGTFEPGTVVDRQTIGAVCLVDFTDQEGKNKADVFQLIDGSYGPVVYSSASEDLKKV